MVTSTCKHHEIITFEDGREIGTCQNCGQVREYGRIQYNGIDCPESREVKIIKEGETMGRHNQVPKEVCERIAEQYRAGMKIAEIRGQNGIKGDAHLYNILDRMGVERRGSAKGKREAPGASKPGLGELRGEAEKSGAISERLEPAGQTIEPPPYQWKMESPLIVAEMPQCFQWLFREALPEPGTVLTEKQRDRIVAYFDACLGLIYTDIPTNGKPK